MSKVKKELEYKVLFNDWIWDIECYPNFFSMAVCFANGSGMRVFEISDRKNEATEMLEFCRKVMISKHRMVGFNNVGFDYPLLHYILEKAKIAKRQGKEFRITHDEIWRHSQSMFEKNKDGDNRFGNAIQSNLVHLTQVDLFKIWHYDNRAKMTGLKMLEFNMRSRNIEDLPFPVGKVLTDPEKDVTIEYNKHDVLETLKFYQYSLDEIVMRDTLTKQFGFDCTNYNDTKIGKELFVNRLEAASPGVCYKQVRKGDRMVKQIQQTKRNYINLGDCILPYISFERPEFKAIHKWFAAQVITETKGALTDLEEHQLGDVAKYANMRVKMKKINCPVEGAKNKRFVPSFEDIQPLMEEHPCGWVEMAPLKSPKGAASYWFCWNVTAGAGGGTKAKTSSPLNVVINGFQYDFGTGGIHGAKHGLTVSGNGKRIYSLDVASYYPNLSIQNNVYPAHLSQLFCTVYQQLFTERRSYDKKSAFNKALKLALNGTYGASGDEYSPMFDPQFMMTITINGQLSLCMLMEKLMKEVDAEIIMCNTDGFEFVANDDPETKKKIDQHVSAWEKLTGLVMEGVLYDQMLVANVNNYIAVYAGGGVKRKGAYEYADLEWHKNQSALVVKMAAEHQLLGRGSAEDFIYRHDDPFDFMLRTKVPKSSRLVLVNEETGEEKQLQNICRYYPSKNSGGKLVKVMPPLKDNIEWRRLSIDQKWNVTPCNNMDDFSWDINYDYYVAQANKLVGAIHGDVDIDDMDDDLEE